MKVKDLATGPAITISGHSPIWLAAETMEWAGHGFLPVTDQGKVVGVITARDLAVRVAAKRVGPEAIPVAAVMSSPAISVDCDLELEEAAILMRQRDVRRLVVEGNGLVGVISLADLAGNASDASVIKTLQRHCESTISTRQPYDSAGSNLFLD